MFTAIWIVLELKVKSLNSEKETTAFTPLPPEVISSVKLFVLFVNYPRSGSSITGSILDAHPNVIMANELNVLEWVQENPNYSKDQLFNSLFENSYSNILKNGKRRRESQRLQSNSGQLMAGQVQKYC